MLPLGLDQKGKGGGERDGGVGVLGLCFVRKYRSNLILRPAGWGADQGDLASGTDLFTIVWLRGEATGRRGWGLLWCAGFLIFL